MKDYDAAHPCLRPAQRDLRWRTFAGTFFRYRQCMKLRADAWLKSLDFVEAINEHASLELNLRPNDADADSLARMISAARKPYSNAHVIIVSHSQGNMIAAQAVQELPSLDGHPVQQATRCVASLALASPIVRDYMALDSEHKDGFVIEGDIILQLKPFGYDILPTAKSATLAAAIAQTRDPVLKTALILGAGLELHRIDNTYLALPEARAAILGRLTELHRECVPGRLVVNPDSLRISAGAIDIATVHGIHGRRPILVWCRYPWRCVSACPHGYAREDRMGTAGDDVALGADPRANSDDADDWHHDESGYVLVGGRSSLQWSGWGADSDPADSSLRGLV
jgi:pimeloyl-ACP methyl ester carboxylesterase